MDRTETIKIMAILQAAYPQYYRGLKKEHTEPIIALWNEMFLNDRYEIVAAAVKALIATNTSGYPPVIGQIREKIDRIMHGEASTELEAWGMVLRAIQDSTYNASLHFDNFPPEIRAIVGTPSQLREWAMMEPGIVNSVVQSNFMRSYSVKVKARKELRMMPDSAKNLISGLTDKLKMIG